MTTTHLPAAPGVARRVEDPLRVVVVDDSDDIRALVGIVLARRTRWEVVGQAATLAEGEQVLASARADVVVLDSSFPDGSAHEALARILAGSPAPAVVVLGNTAENGAARQALDAGAVAFVEKTRLVSQLVPSLTRVVPQRRPGPES